MIRLFLAFVLGTGLLCAQESTLTRFKAGMSEYDDRTGEMLFRHAVQFRDRGALLTADEVRYNTRTKVAHATGNIVITRGTTRLLAQKLVYNDADGSFTAEHVRIGDFPYYAEGESASGTLDEIAVSHARITYGEPGPWQPTVSAERVIYSPGKRIRSENALGGIGPVRPLPFPRFEQNLAAPFAADLTLAGGYRASLGVFAEVGARVPVAPTLRLGADVGVYTSRGVMAGPAATYASPDNGATYKGFLRSGYINDHGDKKTDLLGRPVPEDRAFIEWQHRQMLTEELSFNAQLNWWKDSEVVRDFRPRVFFPLQEPDTFVESAYTGKNYLISAFARLQPNSFQRVQERLPEIRFDLLPIALGGGLYERFSASYARLRERGPLDLRLTRLITNPTDQDVPPPPTPIIVGPTVTLFQADRFDAYYSLTRPIAPTEWFTLTPIVGGRFTHHTNAETHPSLLLLSLLAGPIPTRQTRLIGEIGFDAVLRSSGTFAYKNERWNINGLRHLFTPRISYRYIDADRPNRMPAIDRPVFSTYLQPLGLGDRRDLDTIEDTNVVRVAFDNVLQTRDGQGTRDLASLTIANDFGFRRGRRDVSGLQVELAAMPARWLQFDLYQRFTPRHLDLRETNTGLVLLDGDAWSVRFSNNFLNHQIEDYAVDGRFRLNEAFQLLSRLNYDARRSRFNEQAYGVVQNLGNTWQISYVVSLYSGRRRESSFGFNVQIDALRF